MANIKVICLVALLTALSAASSKLLKREKRTWIIDSFSIEEEYPGPYPYILGTIRLEREYQVNYKLTGNGVDKDPIGVLSIDKDTGNITVHRKVDYEYFPLLMLTFEAVNFSNKMINTKLGVEINILDINDNDPKFQRQIYNTTVKESGQQGLFGLTVTAVDYDKKGTPNSTVDYRIISVTPETPNVQFYIENNGRISFKGCLDYEKAKMYTIVVEAKDRGEVQRRSSSCTVIINVEDSNNHMPIFTGHTGPGRVKEREVEKSILRLQVKDMDLQKTAAWRARYTLHGDDFQNFEVETDPETNDGILSVIKPLDFQKGSQRNLSISVENESPFFSCEVKDRPREGLWTVDYVSSTTGKGVMPKPLMEQITIIVQDVNDPPEFLTVTKDVTVHENIQIGFLLETFTAKDKDTHFSSDFMYSKGKDPAGWVDIDPKTCEIHTAKVLDRESTFVVNETYTVTIYAVDKGEPPMTGTATLNIHLRDQNDNTPQLTTNKLDMCLTDGKSGVNITAFDLDGYPYAGPFRFELLDGAEEQWMVQPSFGSIVRLVTKTVIYAGQHNLRLKISDMQGLFSQQNLTVTVCDCLFEPNCHARRTSSSKAGDGAIAVIFGVLFLLVGLLLLVFFLSCWKGREPLQVEQGSGGFLLKSNTEAPGTDCEILALHRATLNKLSQAPYTENGVFKDTGLSQEGALQSCSLSEYYKDTMGCHSVGEYYQGTMGSHSLKRDQYQISGVQSSTWRQKYCLTRRNTSFLSNKMLLSLLSQRIQSIEAPGKELCDYKPQVYVDEGPYPADPALDTISISNESLDPDMLLELGPKFSSLAAVCKPHP